MSVIFNWCLQAVQAAWSVFAEMAPYLLFGFAIAGILHVALPTGFIERHLGGRGGWPALKAALIGIPLPLCSCSVIPVTAALRAHGASRGATSAFLLSTPQTGVDSILVTYSLLGPLMAVYRPVMALVMGVAGGWLTDAVVKRDAHGAEVAPASCADEDCGCRAPVPAAGGTTDQCGCSEGCDTASGAPRPAAAVTRMLRYAFVSLPRDIGKPLLFGMALASVITALVPRDFFTPYLGHGLIPMLVLMAFGIPMYVCATASVPIAAALILAGVSPGAALVFLITGPVTNAAEIGALWKVLGRRTVAVYLGTVAVGSLVAGLTLDLIVQATGWRVIPAQPTVLMEQVNIAAALVMLAVFVYALWPVRRPRSAATRQAAGIHGSSVKDTEMADKATLAVQGMTCNGCVTSVKHALAAQPGVSAVEVDLASGMAEVTGDGLEVGALVAAVERLGFTAQPQL
jgi:uncharacterized protein